jgi:hypothetical protein
VEGEPLAEVPPSLGHLYLTYPAFLAPAKTYTNLNINVALSNLITFFIFEIALFCMYEYK